MARLCRNSDALVLQQLEEHWSWSGLLTGLASSPPAKRHEMALRHGDRKHQRAINGLLETCCPGKTMYVKLYSTILTSFDDSQGV